MNLLNKIIFILFILITSSILLAKEQLDFSHEHGIYENPFTLTITVEFPNSVIKFTLDGTDPMTSGTAVTQTSPASVVVDPNNTSNRDVAPGFIITVCATESDTLISDVITQTYLFLNKVIELSPDNQKPGAKWMNNGLNNQHVSYGMDPDIYNNGAYSPLIDDALAQIPSMSLVTDLDNLFDPTTGIYVHANMHGEEWERPGSIELLNPDGTKGFASNCGIRIRGGWSRHPENPKHAFRMFFRSEYGNGKLNYPLFGDEGVDKFDKFDLRTAQNYSWSYYGDTKNSFMRDVFSRDSQGKMEQYYTRSRYYHLYINGTYWGLFQTQERSEASFAEQYMGGNREDYDVIKRGTDENYNNTGVEATDGNLDAWHELWDMGEQEDFEDNAVYFKVQGLNPDGIPNPAYKNLVDIDNLIDYEINTFIVGDFDGPVSAFAGNNSSNNFYCIYNRVNPDGFKFIRHDAEHSLFNDGDGDNCCNDRTGPFSAGQNFDQSNPHWTHQRLSENALYRSRFADRAYKHFNNDGVFAIENTTQRILDRKAEIDLAIIAESARWGDSKSDQPRTKVHWENAVNYIINEFLPGRVDDVINQLLSKGLYSTLEPPLFTQHGGIVNEGFNVSFTNNSDQIYYTFDESDPYSPIGDPANNFDVEVISTSTSKKAIIPTADIGTSWISDLNFNDDSWLDCVGVPGGIGYERESGYESEISLDVGSYMLSAENANANSSCYIRIPFEVTSELLSKARMMNLNIKFDDGFVAYLNGVKVAEQFAPSTLSWNSLSTDLNEADNFQSFNISSSLATLNSGTNLLTIHALNTSLTSSDFLIIPILKIGNSSIAGSPSELAILYTGPFPIDETVTIKTRLKQSDSWSSLNEAKFLVDLDLSSLRVTELHYQPLANDTISGKEYEFIELKNVGGSEINLNSATFVDGIEYVFPSGSTLLSGKFYVLVSNKTEFFNRYGIEPFGEYEGQFNNGGEDVVFVNAVGDTVFDFRYNDKDPWPIEAAGLGNSLVSLSGAGYGSPANSTYWIASGEIHGSPGADDILSDVKEDLEKVTPTEYSLEQNFPNPFNPSTRIKYSIPKVGKEKFRSVQLKIFDILGREVAILVNEKQKAGNYEVNFNAENLTSGIYFYRLQSGSFSLSRKMLLVK